MNSEQAALSFRTYALMALTVGVIATVTTAFVLTDASANGGSSSSSTTSSVTGKDTAADPSLGIQLVLSVSPGQGTPSFEVNATVRNTLSRQNNVSGVDDYNGVQVNPLCNTGPVTFEVLEGFYTTANFTAGTVLSIHGVQNMMCIVSASALSYYVFQPNSDVFSGPLQQEQVGPQNGIATMTTRSATTADSLVDVYPGGLASPEPFPTGTYTVVAADNWGQLAAVHFVVTG